MQKPGIFGILEYSHHNCIPTDIQNAVIFTQIGKPLHNSGNSEPWHIDNLGIFRSLTYLKSDTYSEISQSFKMECFVKTIKRYNKHSNFQSTLS